jgi:membrane protein YqaA with SNARE-associated domain
VTILLTFLWAVAEATLWPIMPDAVLVPLALRRPGSWWRLVLGAALGTLVGGVVSYRLGQQDPEHATIERLPLVRPAMVAAADRWLATEGGRGAWRQPATGVPLKVFARLAGARRLPLGQFLLWAAAARSVRFTLVAGLAALLARRFPEAVARHYWLLTLVWSVVFGVALWRLVAFWERRTERAPAAPRWTMGLLAFGLFPIGYRQVSRAAPGHPSPARVGGAGGGGHPERLVTNVS